MELSTAAVNASPEGTDYYSDDYASDYFVLGDPEKLKTFFEFLVYVIGIVGAISNSFAVIVLSASKKLRSKLCFSFIINQTFIDLFSAVNVLLTYGIFFNVDAVYGSAGSFYCRMVWSESLLFTGLYASAFNVLAVAVERLLIIAFPVIHRNCFTRRKVIVSVAGMWVLSFILNIPNTLIVRLVNGSCVSSYIFDSPNAQATYGILLFLITFFLPLLFLTYCYVHMIKVLRQRRMIQPALNQQGSNKLTKAQVNLFKTALIITAFFIICWVPSQVYYFMYSLGTLLSFEDAVYYTSMALALLNGCINPFVYVLKLNAFKARAKHMLRINTNAVTHGDVANT